MRSVSFVIVFCLLALFSSHSHATKDAPTPYDFVGIIQGQSVNVFIHITALNETPKGLTAQIDGFSRNGKAGKNTLKARLEIHGKRLRVQLHPEGPNVAQLTMPAGYQLPQAIAEKLGASNSVVMSGGSTMVKKEEKSMLWFEIQGT